MVMHCDDAGLQAEPAVVAQADRLVDQRIGHQLGVGDDRVEALARAELRREHDVVVAELAQAGAGGGVAVGERAEGVAEGRVLLGPLPRGPSQICARSCSGSGGCMPVVGKIIAS